MITTNINVEDKNVQNKTNKNKKRKYSLHPKEQGSCSAGSSANK